MEGSKTSSLYLRDTLRSCLDGYLRAVKAHAADQSGRVESLARDAAQLGFWAQIVGLDDGNLDPQLSRFRSCIHGELSHLRRALVGSLSMMGESDLAGDDSIKWQTLSSWVTHAFQVPATETTHDVELGSSYPSSPAIPATLDEAYSVSSAVCESLFRLLSSSQKVAFDRALQRWAERIIMEDNLIAPAVLQELTSGRVSPLGFVALPAVQRRYSRDEEATVPERLLRQLERRSEELRWSIPLGQEPSVIEELSRSHSVGLFKERIVLLEKRQNLGWMAEGADAIETFLRIDSLAARLAKRPKPPTFCALNLVGYFSDRKYKGYCFVYEWPWDIGAAWNERHRPKSLNDYLAENEGSEFNIGPSLTQRFELARTIAICVKMFHIFGWLHKSINSHNILLFPQTQPSAEQPAGIPQNQLYLVGFEYSRQNGPNYATEPITVVGNYDLYRHPDVTGFERRSDTASRPNIFERRHDLYALGLLLAEIGTWNRIEVIQSDYYAASRSEGGGGHPTTGA